VTLFNIAGGESLLFFMFLKDETGFVIDWCSRAVGQSVGSNEIDMIGWKSKLLKYDWMHICMKERKKERKKYNI
jgi:hypothetical protein